MGNHPNRRDGFSPDPTYDIFQQRSATLPKSWSFKPMMSPRLGWRLVKVVVVDDIWGRDMEHVDSMWVWVLLTTDVGQSTSIGAGILKVWQWTLASHQFCLTDILVINVFVFGTWGFYNGYWHHHINCRQWIWVNQRQLKWQWTLASHQLRLTDMQWSISNVSNPAGSLPRVGGLYPLEFPCPWCKFFLPSEVLVKWCIHLACSCPAAMQHQQFESSKFWDQRHEQGEKHQSVVDPFTLDWGEFLWTFGLLVAATMIAALSVQEAGSKDIEESVALAQKESFVGYFLWPQMEHLNRWLILFSISLARKNELSPNPY